MAYLDLLYLFVFFLNTNGGKNNTQTIHPKLYDLVHDCFLFVVSELFNFSIIGRQKLI